jgi:acid phosphatase
MFMPSPTAFLNQALFINKLASRGALLTNMHGETHPSQPNYLAMFSGSTQGITNDAPPKTQLAGPSLGGELLSHGFTFKGYSEDLPAVGSLANSNGLYNRGHNPWSDFADVPSSDNVPFSAFPRDFNALPTVSFVVPNRAHDMHSGSIRQADRWLQDNLGGYAKWARTHNSLLIVTFDESQPTNATNRIVTVVDGAGIRPGPSDQRIDHYTLLRTIEDMYALPALGRAADSTGIVGIWR